MNQLTVGQIEKQWVNDPASNVDVNVAPLFYYLRKLDAQPDASLNAGAVSIIERVLKTLNLTVHDPDVIKPDVLASLYHELHLLHEMFSALEQRPAPASAE